MLRFSTLQMLTNIENRLEELFEQIEMMPQDRVEAAEKVPYRTIKLHFYALFSVERWERG